MFTIVSGLDYSLHTHRWSNLFSRWGNRASACLRSQRCQATGWDSAVCNSVCSKDCQLQLSRLLVGLRHIQCLGNFLTLITPCSLQMQSVSRTYGIPAGRGTQPDSLRHPIPCSLQSLDGIPFKKGFHASFFLLCLQRLRRISANNPFSKSAPPHPNIPLPLAYPPGPILGQRTDTHSCSNLSQLL